MPGSLPNPVLYFPAKFIYYSLAGWALKKIYRDGINPFLFGTLRVLIGFGIGLLFIIPMTAFSSPSGHSSDYALLFLPRLVVWTGMIRVLYERKNFSPFRFVSVVILGILLSFVFDAVFSWVSGEFPGWLMVGMC